SPLREALNRLVSDGLVERREQRGCVVAGISAADLAEITQTRCWLEEIALRESIAAHTTAWEEGLVLAHHRLTQTPRSLSDSRFEDNPAWEPLHRAFHRALIAGCGSRWMLAFCEQLADQHHRYRRLSAPRAFAKRAVKSEHQQLMEAALASRADEAVALLKTHFERTAKIIRDDPKLFAERTD
ncbi:MAG: GntR family transcriptional regulator, partial [Burkholderiales bacterium PBB5]